MNYLEQRDWQAAFEATVPKRKRAAGREEDADLKIDMGELSECTHEEHDKLAACDGDMQKDKRAPAESDQDREHKRRRTDGDGNHACLDPGVASPDR